MQDAAQETARHFHFGAFVSEKRGDGGAPGMLVGALAIRWKWVFGPR
jgi:hypothetical protein